MGERLAVFIGAEFRSSAGETIIYVGKPNARIHSRGIGSQPEVEAVRFIELPGVRRIRRRYLLKHVVVDQDAVLVLPGCLGESLERLEFPLLPFRGVIRTSRKWRRIPHERITGILVWTESVVVGSRVVGECIDRENFRDFAAAENQVVSKMQIGYRLKHPSRGGNERVVIHEDSR